MSAQSLTRGTPVREPDLSSPGTMTKRAWWLVVLNLLIPGSAQVLAGNRRVGRFGLASTLVFWALVIIVVGFWLVAPTLVYDAVTNPIALTLAQVALGFYAIIWVIFTLDTLRLTRLVRTAPSARAFIAGFAVILLVATAGSTAYGAYVAGVARSALGKVFSSDKGYAEPINGKYNILLLGGDAGADRTGLRPDSISVVSIDAATGKTTIIGIPRNMQKVPFVKGSPLYGPYPDGYNCGVNCLISYLYTYGQANPKLYPNAKKEGSKPGVEAMRDAVEGVLGITIPYYVLIDMKGFANLIDALGGVTIDVTQRLPINGGQAADGTPINVEGWIEPGVQKMNGHIALWYARSRHSTDDYDRMKRQRQVQEAILSQFSPATVLTKFEAVANAGSRVVKTDIPQVMLGKFVDLAGKARKHKIGKLELVPPTINEIDPDFAKIRSLVAKSLVVSTPSPTPAP